jgi:exosortase E/protease (VPEID-CTERM system)
VLSTATTILRPRPGLAARITILFAVFLAEKLLLDPFVDSRNAQAARGLGGIVREGQHWGFRFIVAFFATLAVFAYAKRYARDFASIRAAAMSSRIHPGWALGHFLLVVCLVPLSFALYRGDGAWPPFPLAFLAWLIVALTAALSALLAMAPGVLWLQATRALGIVWLYAAFAALIGVGAMQASQRLWAPAASLTFNLVRVVLLPILPNLSADSTTRLLSTDRFAVEVADYCSGLEGMGLILIFTATWLFYFRREYIFPRALLLIPGGLLVMFALNALRIAALMLIGYSGFIDVAVYGFHSQAGWIAFNAAACGLAFFSRRSKWLNRNASYTVAGAVGDNPTAVYLIPFLAILAAGFVSRSLSGQFETLYPLRLIAGLAALFHYRHKLVALDWHFSWRAPVVGALVFIIWMASLSLMVPSTSLELLSAQSTGGQIIGIASRVVATALVVPVAEELAYRGYLMRRLMGMNFEGVTYTSVRFSALAVSSAVFGLSHGSFWLPATFAGLAFGWIAIRRGSIGEAVVAHAIANALLAATGLATGRWQF